MYRRCGCQGWDPLYAGVVDRIVDCFYVERPSLATRQGATFAAHEEWNEALKKYCDMGLTGAEREAVVQEHNGQPVHLVQILPATNWRQGNSNLL
jgi:hypothetical protein